MCPNTSSKEWKALVADIGEHYAWEAYLKNNSVIPDLTSDIVKSYQSIKLNYGEGGLKPALEEDGVTEKDQYVSPTGKIFNRITGKIGGFISYFTTWKSYTKPLWEHKADIKWGKLDKDTVLEDGKGNLKNYHEYKKDLERYYNRGIVKGKVIHAILQAQFTPSKAKELYTQANELIALHNQKFNDEVNIKEYEWLLNKDKDGKLFNLKTVLRKVGINTLDEEEAYKGFIRDVIQSEVVISNDILGFAGSIDTLVKHSSGLYSIVDWKTGNTQGSEGDKLSKLLFKYGNQVTNLQDTYRNRAKLQIALYALMLKANNTEMKFQALNVAWIPNEYNARRWDNDMEVDVESFIPMIEQLLKDKNILREMGLDSNTYTKLITSSPDLFNPSHYSSKISGGLQAEIINSPLTPTQLLEKKQAELNFMYSQSKDFFNDKSISDEDKKKARKLYEDILQMSKGNEQLLLDGKDEMGLFTRWFGNTSDVRNRLVNTWSKAFDAATNKYRRIVDNKNERFNTLLTPIKEEYMQGRFRLGRGFEDINYSELYGWMYKDEVVKGLSSPRERLLIKSDPEYSKLDNKRRALLDFMNDTYAEYFKGDGFFNEAATKKMNPIKGKEEVYTHAQLQGFKYYEGFFSKIAKTPEEIRYDLGKGSNIAGAFHPSHIKEMGKRALTYFEEDNYEMYDNEVILPIKYLGNDYINNSRKYSKNAELIFLNFVENAERKKAMQGIYIGGKTLQYMLELQKVKGSPMYANLAGFLNDRIIKDVLQETLRPKFTAKPLRIPVLGGDKHIEVYPDKVIQLLMNWVTSTTMLLKPIQGVGNGIHATLLTHKEGLKGSIAQGFLGIDGNAVDFTERDIAFADTAYFSSFVKDSMFTDIRKNKIWLLAKQFNYFGSNYKYDFIEGKLISLRNKSLDESSLALFHHIPEEFVALTTMVAQLNHMKITAPDGKKKSVLDCYEVVEVSKGQWGLKWTGGVRGYVNEGIDITSSKGGTAIKRELTELDSNEIEKLKKVHERMQGGYRENEGGNIELYVLGKAFIQFKKYLPRLILNALQSKKKDVNLGYYKSIGKDSEGKEMYEWVARVVEGRWITLANHIVATLRLGSSEYKWDKLSPEQKQNIVDAYLTLSTFLGMYGAYLIMFGDSDDDDTAKKFWKMYLVDNLSQQYNVLDLARTMSTATNPVILARSYKQLMATSTLLMAGANYAIGNEDKAFTKLGDVKGFNDFIKGIPYLSSAQSAINAAKHDKTFELNTWFDNNTIRLK